MHKKRILIFGAGDNQVRLIESCRGLGFFTVVVDPDEDASGAYLADLFVQLPAQDYEGHRNLVAAQAIDGIVTCQMEKPLPLMAQLAEEFGFVFPQPDVIRASRNKLLMKQAFVRHGVPCARGIHVRSKEELSSTDFSSLALPLIMKPVDSFSSRGVRKVATIGELPTHFEESRVFSSEGDVLVEEFLDGPEVSVESITWGSRTEVIQFTDKEITPYPRTVELAHLQPTTLPPEVQEEIRETTKAAIDAIGLDNSGSHTELKVTSDGVKVVEIGARLGGDHISSVLTYESTGIDMNRAVAQIAMGFEPDCQYNWRRAAVIRYLELPAGRTVDRVDGLGDVLACPGVVRAKFSLESDAVVPEITESAKRPGFVIVSAEDRRTAERRAIDALAVLRRAVHLR